ncbi:MAG: beta-L-arabinofuranosidase domain-containing protein [Candidatus Sumerlaeota bacterium]
MKKRTGLSTLGPAKAQPLGRIREVLDRTREKWCKGHVPYAGFVEGFRNGRLNNFAGGETWGKAVRAACLFFRYSQDPELGETLQQTVADILSCQKDNGSISCANVEDQPDGPGGDLWERKYVMLALEHYLSDVRDDPAVLASLIHQADCLIQQIGPPPKTDITAGGWSPNHLESSTILEPIMRLYQRTGEQRFLDFAAYIVSQGGCEGYDLIDEALRKVPPHKMAGGIYPKAYEMLSFFEGVLEYYHVTGDERCCRAAIALFDSVCRHEITITGSAGGDAPYYEHGECWDNTAIEQANPELNRTMETCVGVTWMKYCMQIYRLTGESRPADFVERYVYNALMGAAQPSGVKFSYMNRLNGVKSDPNGWGVYVKNAGTFTCCDLNGPMGLACIPHFAVTSAVHGPTVNLFIPGTWQIETPTGQTLGIVIEGNYPVSPDVQITCRLPKPETFGLRLRIPAWSQHSKIEVQGKNQTPPPGEYACLSREWKSGDTIKMTFEMRARAIHSEKYNRVAVVRGPVVFARDENMDRDFDKPVRLVEKDGFIELQEEKPLYDETWQQIRVPTESGHIRMVDYASINNWNGLKTCTWMPVE